MNILAAEAISKSYGLKQLFEQISFGIQAGEKIGLIGVNGTGKSTLLKILAGLSTPDDGEIVKGKQIKLKYLEQNPLFAEDMNVLQYLYLSDSPLTKVVYNYEKIVQLLEIEPENEKLQEQLQHQITEMDRLQAWEWEAQAKSILTKLGISQFEQNIEQLSGGQKKRVALARALIHPADLLILDEPTNHLDHATIEWLEEFLQKYKGALLLITHDRYFLDRVVGHILELDQGSLYRYKGNYSYFVEQKAARIEQLAASEEKRQNLFRRELAWMRRGAKARTTKQKARIDRFHELENSSLNYNEEQLDFTLLSGNRLGKKVIELKDIDKSIADKPLIAPFSFILLPGDRLGIIGPNGSGKSTLLDIIAGRTAADNGEVIQGETVKLGYYDQESKPLQANLKVIDYIKEVAEVIEAADGSSLTASQMLERFLFPGSVQWNTIGQLSGGEKRRLYLLRILMSSPNVLLLDEPTNDLDIQTLTILEEYLDQFKGAVITVSHDRYFLDRTVKHLYYFEKEGQLKHFNGSYTEYLELQVEEQETLKQQEKEQEKQQKAILNQAASQNKENTAQAEDNLSAAAKPKRLSYHEQREYETIEAKITSLEEKNEQLQAAIAQITDDYEQLIKYSSEQKEVEQELEALIERWAELSERA